MSTKTTDSVSKEMACDTMVKAVERERDRIVAWLREQAKQYRLTSCISAPEWRDALLWAASDIERGKDVRRARDE